jgi:hypothetical protein
VEEVMLDALAGDNCRYYYLVEDVVDFLRLISTIITSKRIQHHLFHLVIIFLLLIENLVRVSLHLQHRHPSIQKILCYI